MVMLCFQRLITNSVKMPVRKWIFSQNYQNPSNTVYRYRQDFLKFVWKGTWTGKAKIILKNNNIRRNLPTFKIYYETTIFKTMWVIGAYSVVQSCLTPWNPMDWSPPGSSVHRISQPRVSEGLPFPLQRSFPTQGLNSHLLCLLHGRQIFCCWTIWEALRVDANPQSRRDKLNLRQKYTQLIFNKSAKFTQWRKDKWYWDNEFS